MLSCRQIRVVSITSKFHTSITQITANLTLKQQTSQDLGWSIRDLYKHFLEQLIRLYMLKWHCVVIQTSWATRVVSLWKHSVVFISGNLYGTSGKITAHAVCRFTHILKITYGMVCKAFYNFILNHHEMRLVPTASVSSPQFTQVTVVTVWRNRGESSSHLKSEHRLRCGIAGSHDGKYKV